MAGAGGNQNRAQAAGPNVVCVAVDPEGCVRLVPGNAIGAGRMYVPSEKRKNQDQQQKDSTVHLTSVRLTDSAQPPARTDVPWALPFHAVAAPYLYPLCPWQPMRSRLQPAAFPAVEPGRCATGDYGSVYARW